IFRDLGIDRTDFGAIARGVTCANRCEGTSPVDQPAYQNQDSSNCHAQAEKRLAGALFGLDFGHALDLLALPPLFACAFLRLEGFPCGSFLFFPLASSLFGLLASPPLFRFALVRLDDFTRGSFPCFPLASSLFGQSLASPFGVIGQGLSSLDFGRALGLLTSP